MQLGKRAFLKAGMLGLGGLGLTGLAASNALAQAAAGAPAAPAAGRGAGRSREVPHRMAKTTVLFKAPPGHPNALATQEDGLLWIGEQRDRPSPGQQPTLAQQAPYKEKAWLVDWTGKILKTVETESANTSGMAYGDGCVWMCANAAPFGVFQTDMTGKTVSHRQVPLGPPTNGGGLTGAVFHDGKLYLSSSRLQGILRVDAKTWAPEFLIPMNLPPGRDRLHGLTFDNGAIWIVTGNDSTDFNSGKPGLAKYDAATGELLETVDFVPGSADPHGLAMHNGSIVSCDAGIHPGWQNNISPFVGTIFRVDFI